MPSTYLPSFVTSYQTAPPPRRRFSVSPSRIAEIAQKAAEALMTRGWAQGTMMRNNGSVCAQGAILCALEAAPVPRPGHQHPSTESFTSSPMASAMHEEFEAIDHLFAEVTGRPTVRFNDEHATSVEQVINVFKAIYERALDEVGRQTHHKLPDQTITERRLEESSYNEYVGYLQQKMKKQSDEYVRSIIEKANTKVPAVPTTQAEAELAGGPE